MKKTKKRQKKKQTLWIIVGAVVAVLSLGYFLIRTQYSTFEKLVKDGVNFFAYPIWNRKKEDQTESYLIQKNVNKALLEEIESLKKMLELNQAMTDYQVINTTLVNRQIDYWLQTIVVDKGEKDEVEADYLAITENGLIGRVKRTTNFSSEIQLLTASAKDFQLSVQVEQLEKTTYGVLSGYDEKEGVFLVTGMDDMSLQVGTDVVTSGLTGNYPKGIYVGTIDKIESTSSYEKVVKIKPKQDFNQIHYVSILKRKKV